MRLLFISVFSWHYYSSDKQARQLIYLCTVPHRLSLSGCTRFLKTGITRIMMTSSNGNIFRVTGHCAGNSPVTGEFPTQRPVTRSFDAFFDLRLNKINGWVNKRKAGDLRCNRAHYDVIVIFDSSLYWGWIKWGLYLIKWNVMWFSLSITRSSLMYICLNRIL